MPLFCIIGHDAPGATEKRNRLLQAHIQYLSKLKQQNRLMAVGPLFSGKTSESEYSGSMLLVEFDTIEEARAWYEQDDYYLAGVYQTLEVRPYIDAMPFC